MRATGVGVRARDAKPKAHPLQTGGLSLPTTHTVGPLPMYFSIQPNTSRCQTTSCALLAPNGFHRENKQSRRHVLFAAACCTIRSPGSPARGNAFSPLHTSVGVLNSAANRWHFACRCGSYAPRRFRAGGRVRAADQVGCRHAVPVVHAGVADHRFESVGVPVHPRHHVAAIAAAGGGHRSLSIHFSAANQSVAFMMSSNALAPRSPVIESVNSWPNPVEHENSRCRRPNLARPKSCGFQR